MGGNARIGVVQPEHEPDRDPVGSHGIDPRTPELVPLRAVAQRPAERVYDAVQWLWNLPDLLDSERPDLGLAPVGQVELLDRGARQVAPGPLGEHGRLSGDVRSRLEVGELLVLLAPTLIAGADPT